MAVNDLYKATGRRKTAVAHVRLVSGTGKWTVNGVEVERYIPSDSLRDYINQPFVMTETAGKYDVLVSAKGGGIAGQAGAMRHALSRALCALDAVDGPLARAGDDTDVVAGGLSAAGGL